MADVNRSDNFASNFYVVKLSYQTDKFKVRHTMLRLDFRLIRFGGIRSGNFSSYNGSFRLTRVGVNRFDNFAAICFVVN
jgi:hypothetical protein